MNITNIQIINNDLQIYYKGSENIKYLCDINTKTCSIDPKGQYTKKEDCISSCTKVPVKGSIPRRLISTFTSELSCSNISAYKSSIINSISKLQFNCISLAFFKPNDFSSADYSNKIMDLGNCLSSIDMTSDTLCTDITSKCPEYNNYLIGTESGGNIFSIWYFIYLFKDTFKKNNTTLAYGGKPIFIISFGGASGAPFDKTFDTLDHSTNFGKNCNALCSILEQEYEDCVFGIDLDIEDPYGGDIATSTWYQNFINSSGFLNIFKKKNIPRLLTCEVFGCTSSISDGSFYDSIFTNCSPTKDSTFCIDYISIMADNIIPQKCVQCQDNKDESRCIKYNIYSYHDKFSWPLKNIFYLLYSDYLGSPFDNMECDPLFKITNKCNLSTTFWEMRIISELSNTPSEHLVQAMQTIIDSTESCLSIDDTKNWLCPCPSSSSSSCNPLK